MTANAGCWTWLSLLHGLCCTAWSHHLAGFHLEIKKTTLLVDFLRHAPASCRAGPETNTVLLRGQLCPPGWQFAISTDLPCLALQETAKTFSSEVSENSKYDGFMSAMRLDEVNERLIQAQIMIEQINNITAEQETRLKVRPAS